MKSLCLAIILGFCYKAHCYTPNRYDAKNDIYSASMVNSGAQLLTLWEQYNVYRRLRMSAVLRSGYMASWRGAVGRRQQLHRFMANDMTGRRNSPTVKYHYNHLYSSGASAQADGTAYMLLEGFADVCNGMGANKRIIMWLESLAVKNNLNRIEAATIRLFRHFFRSTCKFSRIRCPRNRLYRTIDGSCNNRVIPSYGQAGTYLRRFIPSEYDDKFNSPRITTEYGQPLPNARLISLAIHSHVNAPTHRSLTHFLMQWGQFLDHDVTLTPMVKNDNVEITCCAHSILPPGSPLAALEALQMELNNRSECFPITIYSTDPTYPTRGCMNFVRSAIVPKDSCLFGCREQVNDITAFIDASNIYGSTPAKERRLVDRRTGELRLQTLRGNQYLTTDPEAHCSKDLPGQTCFASGDDRVNEQPGLTSMHTIFTLEHNRLVRALKRMNPQYSPRILYNEARKILGAILQQITYSEFLPIILGPDTMTQYGLNTQRQGYFTGYDRNVDPSVRNAFATAAYRFGHSLIGSVMRKYDSRGVVEEELPLSTLFEKPYRLYQPHRDGMSAIVRGLSKDNIGMPDSLLTNEVTDHLFEKADQLGLDLGTLNIQRGRDHGLPPYFKFRGSFGLSVPNTFNDLIDIPAEIRTKLATLYNSVRDVDLFVAGLSETPLPGALVGPTFARIIATQFRLMKLGDRFYYENRGSTGFTPAQLTELRKVTLASIICRHVDMTRIQPALFRSADTNRNVPVRCTNLPRIDLRRWRGTARGMYG